MKPDALLRWRRTEAEWVLGRAPIDALSEAATLLLSELPRSSALLAELALVSKETDPRDVRDYVAGILLELGLEPLTRAQAARIAAQGVADRMTRGLVEPEAGARDIWFLAEAMTTDERPAAMIALASDWDEHPTEQPAIRREMLQAAEVLAGGRSGSSAADAG